MTTGELLNSLSTVTGVSALTHLQNIECEGGSGALIPYDEIILDMQINTMNIDIDANTMIAEIQTQEIYAEISSRYLSIDLQITNKEIDNVCN